MSKGRWCYGTESLIGESGMMGTENEDVASRHGLERLHRWKREYGWKRIYV